MLLTKSKQLTSNPFNVRVPLVNVSVLVHVMALCNAQLAPTPLKFTKVSDLPAMLIVLPVVVARKSVVPVIVKVMVAEAVNDPVMAGLVVVQVPLNPVKFISPTQLAAVIAVTLPAWPADTHTFGAVAEVPPVVPRSMVLVVPLGTGPVSLNPPVPVGVKPVSVGIDITVAAVALKMLM